MAKNSYCSVFILTFFSLSCVLAQQNFPKGCYLKNIIPYMIGAYFSETQEAVIERLLGQISDKTCLEFPVFNNATVYEARTSIKFFKSGKKCETILELPYPSVSTLGDRSSAKINLHDNCFKYKMVMQNIFHALGFEHEHQRKDRNCYVKVSARYVNTELYNIKPHAAWIERMPYDKFSVTHLPASTIMRDKDEAQGSVVRALGNGREELTELDVWKLRYKYCNAPHYCDVNGNYCDRISTAKTSASCSK